MARFAQAAERGGAVGIRVNGPHGCSRRAAGRSLPVTAIQKRTQPDGMI